MRIASLSAASIASPPPGQRYDFVSPAGATAASRVANSTDVVLRWAMNVELSVESCCETASVTAGLQCPTSAGPFVPEIASRYSRPSTSHIRTPRARSKIRRESRRSECST